jgi:hypothetical protein
VLGEPVIESCRRATIFEIIREFAVRLSSQSIITRQNPSFSAWQTAWQPNSRGSPRGSRTSWNALRAETVSRPWEAHDRNAKHDSLFTDVISDR